MTSQRFLISIRPEFSAAIYAGTKLFELRRRAPVIEGRAGFLIYTTRPEAAILGGFWSDRVVLETAAKLWSCHGESFGIDRDRYDDYFRGAPVACAIRVSQVFRLPRPVSLSEMRALEIAPPQAWNRIGTTLWDQLLNR